MINRELIRLKVVQLMYEHHVNGGSNKDKIMHELEFSLQKSYDLYHYLLMYLVDLHRVAERQVEAGIQRWNRVHTGDCPSRRFIDGAFIRQLADNEQLQAYCANEKWTWIDQEQHLLRTYQKILVSDYYMKYMALPAVTYDDDREVWYQIYLDCVCNNDFIESMLEDQSIYWNDDKHLIDSFVLKTIKQFKESKGAEQHLLNDYRNKEDREFADDLLEATLRGADTYNQIIAAHLQTGWDLERIAIMDLIIMQAAIAEIINFPTIPLNVTLNEFIEIAKTYSTPQSGAYINGMLDAISHTLHEQGQITKETKSKKPATAKEVL